MSEPGGLSNASNSTTLKTQCKNQNESILESGIPLQKASKQMKFSAYFIKFIGKIRCLSFQSQSVNMVSSVNKYKLSLEPDKHINDRVAKLLHQTEEALEL